jgi:hypothetical protein
MATRNGNIDSEIPLVRVTRQGPESHSGSRMVGTIGPASEGKVPELYISAGHGNIDIKSSPPLDKNATRWDTGNAPFQPAVNKTEAAAAPPSSITAATNGTTIRQGKGNEQDTAKQAEYGTQLVILKALQEGQISVEEADQLLRSLGS